MSDLDLLIEYKGGYFTPEMTKGELGELINYFNSYLQESLKLWQISGPLGLSTTFQDTKFAFLGNRAPDCFVYRKEQSNFIGMSIGYPLILADTYFALMSHPEVLPEIGEGETEDGWKLETGLPETGAAKHLDLPPTDDLQQAGFFRIPRNSERRHYAIELTLDALTFLLYHELAHIFRGHLYSHCQATGFSFLDESEMLLPESAFGFDATVGENSLTVGELVQFFEIDADAVAADILMYEKAPMDFPESTGRFEEVVARLNRALLAISVLFIITGTPRSLTDYRNSKYPHPRTRYQLAFINSMSSIIQLLKLPDDEQSLPELYRLFAPSFNSIKIIRSKLYWGSSVDRTSKKMDEAFKEDLSNRLEFHKSVNERLFVEKSRSTLAPLDRKDDSTTATL